MTEIGNLPEGRNRETSAVEPRNAFMVDVEVAPFLGTSPLP